MRRSVVVRREASSRNSLLTGKSRLHPESSRCRRADAGIKFPLQIVEVIELDETHSGHERNERSAIFRSDR